MSSLVRTVPALSCDFVLCPGDLTHRASATGLGQALSYLWELQRLFNARGTFFTVGNHDISSRAAPGDPFGTLKQLHPAFPFEDHAQANQFWTQGFAIAPMGSDADIVILNTAHDHYTEARARSGTFDEPALSNLARALETTPAPPLRIALLHHHPILHSFPDASSSDVLPNGDRILSTLGKNGCSFVIHGHKHHPRLARVNAGGRSMLLLAAGSFAKYKEAKANTNNVFHLLELEAGKAGDPPTGSLLTWEFNYGKGWRPVNLLSTDFPHHIKFGQAAPADFATQVMSTVSVARPRYLSLEDLKTALAFVELLLPNEQEALIAEIERSGTHKPRFDRHGSFAGIDRRGKKAKTK